MCDVYYDSSDELQIVKCCHIDFFTEISRVEIILITEILDYILKSTSTFVCTLDAFLV